MSARFDSFACNWIHWTKRTLCVSRCCVFFLLFFLSSSCCLVTFLLGTLHLFSQKKSHFGTLYSTINTHNFIYVYRTVCVCLCVKLSRNVALNPHIFSSLLTLFHCLFSLFLSHFFAFHLVYISFDTILSWHAIFCMYVRTLCICSIFKAILFFSLLSFLLALSFNLNLVLDLPLLSLSLPRPNISVFLSLWLKHFLSEIDKRLYWKSCFSAATAMLCIAKKMKFYSILLKWWWGWCCCLRCRYRYSYYFIYTYINEPTQRWHFILSYYYLFFIYTLLAIVECRCNMATSLMPPWIIHAN